MFRRDFYLFTTISHATIFATIFDVFKEAQSDQTPLKTLFPPTIAFSNPQNTVILCIYLSPGLYYQ